MRLIEVVVTRLRTAMVVGLTLLSPQSGRADGAFYMPGEWVAPGVPYQRAVLAFDGQTETLLVQSQYELVRASRDSSRVNDGEVRPEAVAWVVPVPSVPEFASIPAATADQLFDLLWLGTRADYILHWYKVAAWYLVLALFLGSILLLIFNLAVGIWFKKHQKRRWVVATLGLWLSGSLLFMGVGSRQGDAPGNVTVLMQERVGSYDVQVVSSESSDSLVVWLTSNGFDFDRNDRRIFDDYIARNWCFVTAKVEPNSSAAEVRGRPAHDPRHIGTVEPMVMRFTTGVAVYPLALTGTSGKPTLVELYVLSAGRMTGDATPPLRYAGRVSSADLAWFADPPMDQLPEAEARALGWLRSAFDLGYLTKFRGELLPEQMQSDLVLRSAEDDEPFRERIYH